MNSTDDCSATSAARSDDAFRRLESQNRRLRVVLAALIGAAVGAGTLGLADGIEPRRSDPVSITTDGTYLYLLHRSGNVNRLDIESRQDFNKQRPDIFYRRPASEPNLFYLHQP